MDIDGEEFYYGSMCAFKNHGITPDEQKQMKKTFTKNQKNAKLIEIHIEPLRRELELKLSERIGFNNDKFSSLYNDNCIKEYNRVIQLRAKKYKITL